jgi:GntR family transcriptional regulator
LPAAAASQVISAQLADSLVAPLLQVQPGSALIWVSRQVRDQTGRVIETIEALYRPDLYEYQIDLVRRSGRWGPAPSPAGSRRGGKSVLAG